LKEAGRLKKVCEFFFFKLNKVFVGSDLKSCLCVPALNLYYRTKVVLLYQSRCIFLQISGNKHHGAGANLDGAEKITEENYSGDAAAKRRVEKNYSGEAATRQGEKKLQQ
jgi:hypothetical protein